MTTTTNKELKALITNTRILCIFMAVMLLTSSCANTQEMPKNFEKAQEWKLVKREKGDSPTWAIHTRRLEGKSNYEFKIEGDVEAAADACLDTYKQDLLDLAHGVKIDKKFPLYNLLDETEDSLKTYVIHKEPFPLKNTEMCIRYRFYSKEDGGMGVRWKEAWDEAPIAPSKKLSRVKSFRGTWEFTPSSAHSNKAVNSVQFDSYGMPVWLFKPMVVNFLVKGLKKIREGNQ